MPEPVAKPVAPAAEKPAQAPAKKAAAPAQAGKKSPQPFDVVTPVVTAKDIVSGLKLHMLNMQEKRLQALARKNRDVAALLAKVRKQDGTITESIERVRVKDGSFK